VPVAQQRAALDRAVNGHVLPYSEFDIAGRNAGEQVFGQGIGKANVDIGVRLAIESDHPRHQRAGHELGRCKAQHSFLLVTQIRHTSHSARQVAEQPVHGRQELTARFRKLHAPRVAVEQFHADFALEFAHQHAERRLREM
jgi:hypothetical protein